MSSRTSFTCDICGREVLASLSTGHNPLGSSGWISPSRVHGPRADLRNRRRLLGGLRAVPGDRALSTDIRGSSLKRNLITLTAIYLLYERQKRVERRQKLWKLRTEADMRHWAEEVATEYMRFAEAVNDQCARTVDELGTILKEAR